MKVKPFLWGGLGLLVVAGLLVGIKGLQIKAMISKSKQMKMPPEVVTVARAQNQSWEQQITAVGSLEAVHGVTITAELTGKVTSIPFEPGTKIRAGELLLQQDVSAETAQLRAAEVAVDLARINFERSKKMLQEKVVAASNYDNADAQLKQALAQIDTIKATIAKKTIRAPFAGRLGIRQVNIGQIIKEGEPIVSLQALDPIFVNFLVPQQQIPRLQTGLTVRLTSDGLPAGHVMEGTVTAFNPDVDAASRNIRVQATVANAAEQLRPGMYANVAVVLPEKTPALAIPATSVLYAPYSDSVFVVEAAKGEEGGKAGKIVRQQFVRLGEKRGDFITVLSGLKEEEEIVSTGVFKLRNGQDVVIDNTLAPTFNLAPKPQDG